MFHLKFLHKVLKVVESILHIRHSFHQHVNSTLGIRKGYDTPTTPRSIPFHLDKNSNKVR